VKQNVGLSAFIIAALMVAVRTGGPAPAPGQTTQPSKSAPKAAASQTAPLGGPWLATRSFFQASEEPDPPTGPKGPVDFTKPSTIRDCVRATPGVCRAQLAGYFGVRRPERVEFLLGTVPDPLHSRLSLLTDSAIQAIEDAAQSSGWIFAAQWLPWIDATNPEEKDPEKRREERESVRIQEEQPGILVFRQSAEKGELDFGPRVLMVFLAGETPTAGVNPSQFQLARAYMRAIHEPADEVRVLGPTFSGSFYSLVELLKEDRVQGKVPGYRFRSGTATGTLDGETLQRQTGVTFRGAMANTQDQNRYFQEALRGLGVDNGHAALLVENESAYGQGAAALAEVRVFRFPRDISHLRDAYKDAVAASKSTSVPTPDIEFSLKDPATGEDSIPIFSGSQSPLSQNGVVNSIANAIQREGIRLVRVDATNVLDMLFLADVLKRQCPDTRLILNYPDVLLVQAAHSDPLTGTLVFTSYPAFLASNRWMGGSQKYYPVTFPDGNSEGIYNATVLLLNCDSDPAHILGDYHWRELRHPPTWLLTLDRQGFLPVNVFPHNRQLEENEHWFRRVTPPPDGMPPLLPTPPRLWNFIAATVAFACLALSIWIPWISLHPRSEMDARLSFFRIDAESDWRRVHIFALLAILLLMDLTIWIPGLQLDRPAGFTMLLAGSGLAVLAVAAYVLERLGLSGAGLAAWLGLAGVARCLAWWWASCFFFGDQGEFFALRARELRFGSSPTWPILTSLAALALFAFVQLTRCYLAACQRPDILTSGLASALEPRLQKAWEDFNGVLSSCSGLQLTDRIRRWKSRGAAKKSPVAKQQPAAWDDSILLAPALVLAVAVFGNLFHINEQLRTIDDGGYNWFAMSLQFLLVFLLLLTCVRIRLLWQSLQSFLTSLGTLPIAQAFKPVDGSGADRPIWVRRLNLQSIDIHVQAVYVLHNMTRLAKTDEARGWDSRQRERLARIQTSSDQYGELIKELLNVDPDRTRTKALELTKTMRSTSKLIAQDTFEFLHDYWLKAPLVSPGVRDGEKPEEKPAPLDELAGLAQRFVALHYSSFILYVVRQIQNLLLFVSSGFVLLMISLNCYSIQAPQFTGRLLLLLFVIIGAATFSCLAGLERDTILSRMTGSDPGKFNSGFYLKIAAYGGLPALSLLASEFPSISNFLLSWVEPTLEALK
jgi:hypothetical protein